MYATVVISQASIILITCLSHHSFDSTGITKYEMQHGNTSTYITVGIIYLTTQTISLSGSRPGSILLSA